MSSKEYLEALAKKYLNEALVNERIGNKIDAAKNYRKAAEIIMKILIYYRNNPMSDIYKNIAESYIKRAQELEEGSKESISIASSNRDENPADIEDSIKSYIVIEKPLVRFEDIIGLDDAKQAVMDSIIYPVKRPDLFPQGWPRGILLYGPPGCGKTMLVAAVINEIDGIFIKIDPSNIMSKWLGEAEKRVAMIFSYARKIGEEKPVIIFIDEADSLLGVYEHEIGGEVRVRNQLLEEIDGLNEKSKKHFVYVIAATNKPWKLDIGFLRRFQKRIYIPPPNKEARKQLLEYYTEFTRLAPNVNLDEIAEKTEGYSASDIRDIVLEAYLRAVRELFKSGNINGEPRPIDMNDFLSAINSRRPSISKEMVKLYEKWVQSHGTTIQ